MRIDKPGRVLVVDDNPAARNSLAMLLGAQGYAVDCAAGGREALERLRSGLKPGLILLDLSMPGMDGWEFLRQKGQSPEAADVPVVVLTGAGRSARPAVRSLGADDFLQKPVEAERLLDTIDRYC
jgi:CheY-like chemotaxis protein